MEILVAEQIEKRRYNAILGKTVGLLLFFTPLLILVYLVSLYPDFEDFVDFIVGNILLLSFLTMLICLGLAMLVVFSVILGAITTKILRDPQLRAAVNNEMFLSNDRRSVVWAYYITLTAMMVMFVLVNLTPIDVKFAVGILLYVAVVGAKVCQLIAHRG